MLKSDPLPTDKQRMALCEMIAYAFIEIRALVYGGQSKQAADLADAFHNIPREMYGWGQFRWDRFGGALSHYQTKWEKERSKFDYVGTLRTIQTSP